MNLKEQNKEEFSHLIEKNQGIIHKIALLYTNSFADREDLFQEICLQLWKSFSSFKGHAKFNTWMYRVAINTAIDHLRKQRKELAFEPLMDIHTRHESSDDHEQVKLLYRSVSKLNPIDKAIILMWLEEKNYEEIAEVMGITKSNVSVKLVRIKRKIQQLINNE